jgi:hypothetical protein
MLTEMDLVAPPHDLFTAFFIDADALEVAGLADSRALGGNFCVFCGGELVVAGECKII